jgi:hypothetical protein
MGEFERLCWPAAPGRLQSRRRWIRVPRGLSDLDPKWSDGLSVTGRSSGEMRTLAYLHCRSQAAAEICRSTLTIAAGATVQPTFPRSR